MGQLSLKGWIHPQDNSGCGSCATRSSSSAQPFELAFRQGSENYAAVRSGDAKVATDPTRWIELPVADSFETVELLAVRSSGPVNLRFNGQPARVLTSAAWPVSALAGTTLNFGVDGYPLVVTFAIGEDTALEVARRINAIAALGGLPWQPAKVVGGQVQIEGELTGPLGAITDFAGDATPLLGLAAFPGAHGLGAEVELDGVGVWQFKRGQGARKIEINGSASVTVLAAGT